MANTLLTGHGTGSMTKPQRIIISREEQLYIWFWLSEEELEARGTINSDSSVADRHDCNVHGVQLSLALDVLPPQFLAFSI